GEDFVYAGKVGTGFNAEAGRALLARLQGLERAEAAFAHVPSAGRRGAHWVAPNLVCEIEFLAWTEDGLLRHPSFQGLREDKPAEAVVRERPADIPAPAARRRSAAPAAARPDGAVAVAGARLTSPDKVLWPEAGLTKRGLAEYYEAVAGLMLPHIAGRALSVIRCPAGRTKACFFQRHAASGLPAGVRGVPLAGENGAVKPHLVVEDVIGLVGLVQIGVLEVHPWGSRAEDAEHPDRMVFDLDPAPDVPWERVREAALMVRDRLDGLGLRSFCKTTGGKGLHVVVPLRPERPWPDLHAFAKAFAARLEAEAPDRFLDTAAKGERGGRIYLDWLRNERGASAVAPYSTRAKPGAPVATPLAWDEVPALEAGRFDVARVLERVRAKGFQDPWVGFDAVDQALNDDLLRAVAAE
ncbi:MAG TPA: DNA ligase D, partial [Alphaproteobacteria bacterium]|nr:DNA ligase D [Alphaproteobacteria bacterium]